MQRVLNASVTIEEKINGQIEKGLAVLLGIVEGDSRAHAEILAKKLVELRIFTDENDKMNRSVTDENGGILIISQFTLAADCSHGRRPSFIKAARPETAIPLYEHFIKTTEQHLKKPVACGIFGADMKLSLTNDGPVTIILDTDDFKIT